MKTPNITSNQIVTIVAAVLALGAAFGLPLSDVQSAAILGVVTVLGSVLLHSDAKIRNGRAEVVKAQVEADSLSTSLGPAPPEGQPAHGLVDAAA